MSRDSDDMPLDGEDDLTANERRALRRMLRDNERATWARKKLQVLVPAFVAVVAGIWQAWDWAVRHIKVTP